jgi:hypothetical protein
MRRRWLAGIALLVLTLSGLAACGRAAAARTHGQPLVLRVVPERDSVRLVLVAGEGWKINARLKPVVEAADGRLLYLDAHRLTADSSYFAEPPSVVVAGPADRIRGRLRASVCAAGEAVCRTVALEVGAAE